MPDIPNTGTNGLVLSSVGNGTNASQWITSTSGGSTTLAGDVTGPSGSNTVAKINGTTLGTLTGATNGQVLTWDTPTSTWVPSAQTLDGYAVNLGITLADGEVLYYSTYAGVNAIVATGPPTGAGSVMYWNGGYYSFSGTASTSVTQYLKWTPGSPGSWTPSTITLGGDLSGSSSAATVTGIQNIPVSGTSTAANGQIMYYTTTGASQFTLGPTPLSVGQYYSWGGSAWTLSSAGGGITNDAQNANNTSGSVSTSAGPVTLPSAVQTTAMSGFTTFAINLSISISSTSACTVQSQIYSTTAGALIGIPTSSIITAGGRTTLSNTYVVTGLSAGTSYAFELRANVGAGTGSHSGATISAIGIR